MISTQCTFGSFPATAPGGEDVVLRRALHAVPAPCYRCTEGAVALDALAAVGWAVHLPGQPLHALSVATLEQAHDLRELSPWVIVVAGVVGADLPTIDGYRHCQRTASSDILCDLTHSELAADLSYAPSAGDDFSTPIERELLAELGRAQDSARHWQARALEGWNDTAILSPGDSAVQELAAMRKTISWRVTRPLRIVRARYLAGVR